MAIKSPIDLANLLDPIDIPPFKHNYDKSTWIFPGAKVSTKVYGGSGCALHMERSLHTMEGNMLSLAEHTSLLYLAMSYYKGDDLTQISQDAVTGARAVFESNLIISLTASNRGATSQFFFGEAHNDIVKLGKLNGAHVSAIWYRNPLVTNTEPLEYDEGPNTIVTQTELPLREGVALNTNDGCLNPDTGMPFATDPSTREHSQMFLSEIARAILNTRVDNYEGDNNLFDGMGGPRELIQVMDGGFQLEEIRGEIGQALDLLKPVFRISHNFNNEPLNEHGNTLVSMRGIDEISDFFVPVLGYVGPHCGIQPRSIRRYGNE